MIYITGDTHGQYDLYRTKNFNLKEGDYLIIAGDFGGCWIGDVEEGTTRYYELMEDGKLNYDKETQDYWASKPYTVLFVDGNHENFDALSKYPITNWNGGKVQFLRPNIIHLMRGQIYTIEGKTFFTMGGAESIDKAYRTEKVSWWKEEMPSREELEEGLDNLEKHNMEVDYVITHCCPEKLLIGKMALMYPKTEMDTLTSYFNHLVEDFGLKCKHWYFGHYHFDDTVMVNNIKFTCLYYNCEEID